MNNSVVLNIESIGESIELLDRELNDFKRQANDGYLKNKPDEAVSLFPNSSDCKHLSCFFFFFHRSNCVLHNLLPFASK